MQGWQLAGVFILARLMVLAAALGGAAIAEYDTSAHILNDGTGLSDCIARALTRWDMIYFVSIAQRGYVMEQEYAFFPGFIRIWGRLTQVLCGREASLTQYALVASATATACHAAAVVVLRMITQRLYTSPDDGKRASDAVVVLASWYPAGIFLTTGYNEAPVMLLTLLVVLFELDPSPLRILLQAVCILGACSMRSNSMLLFIVVLWKVVVHVRHAITQNGWSVSHIALGVQRHAVTLLVFASTGAIALLDMYSRGSRELCYAQPTPVWCRSWSPLRLYGYVQQEYWGVGWLTYYTANNIPNFLLAFPAFLLAATSAGAFVSSRNLFAGRRRVSSRVDTTLESLVLMQGILALTCLLVSNVQIFTRVSSCLPLPYIYLARQGLCERHGSFWLYYFVIYSLVQAGLYGAFMPPA